MKKLSLSISLLLIFITPALCQLSGRLFDAKRVPVPYASVSVLRLQDSAVVQGTITDDQGKFSIPAPADGGIFMLRLSTMGFITQYTAPFKISGKSFLKDFGIITLQEDSRLLREVTVKALRPAVTVKSDKIVVSVEGTALAAGSSAFEVLEKIPGVWIDQDGNIQLNGKDGVRVMVDNRPSYLSGKELQVLLEGMSAENIKNIEVITNPSSKYEAAGSSGILNIRLKQNTVQGMNGSVYGGYQYNRAIGYSVGSNINYKKGKWNAFMNADMARRPRLREGVMIREFHSDAANARFHQLRDEDMTLKAPSLRLGSDFALNKKHNIGGLINLNLNSTDRTFLSTTQLHDRLKNELDLINADNFNNSSNRSGAINVYYQGLFDTVGTTVSMNLDYIQLDNAMDSRYENLYRPAHQTETLERLRSDNPGYYDIFSANADVKFRISRQGKLESGIKASRVLSGNELNFYRVNPEEVILDETRSNNYRYTEDILAAYLNYSTLLGGNWSLQAGLRGEQTQGSGRKVAGGSAVSKNYFDLFPSLFISQKVNEHYQLTYSYSRRIDRPNYRSMNPFIFYLDPYSWSEGNPGLRPQYTNSIQITQTLKNNYSLMVGYSSTKDFFAEVPQQNPAQNTTIYQERNIDRSQDLTVTLMAPVRISGNWEVSNNVVVGLQKNKIILQNKEMKNDQAFLTAQSAHNILLPYGLQLQATAAYSSPSTFGVYRFQRQWWLDAGVKKALLNKKLDVTLAATDIFRTRQIHGDASYNGNIFNFVNYFMVQSVKLNLRYNFQSGQTFKSKNRKTNLEELNRAGG